MDEELLDVDEETSEVDGEVIVDKMKVQCSKPLTPLEPGGEVKIFRGGLQPRPPRTLEGGVGGGFETRRRWRNNRTCTASGCYKAATSAADPCCGRCVPLKLIRKLKARSDKTA